MTAIRLAIVACALLLSACADAPDVDTADTVDFLELIGGAAPPVPDLDSAAAGRGEVVYQQHCASCHGSDLAGNVDWKTPNDDGSWKPPPHDSTGHTWHHSDQLLSEIIRNGGGFEGTQMPAFGALLSDGEINDVLEYIKTNWGEQERAFQWQVTWQDANRQAD